MHVSPTKGQHVTRRVLEWGVDWTLCGHLSERDCGLHRGWGCLGRLSGLGGPGAGIFICNPGKELMGRRCSVAEARPVGTRLGGPRSCDGTSGQVGLPEATYCSVGTVLQERAPLCQGFGQGNLWGSLGDFWEGCPMGVSLHTWIDRCQNSPFYMESRGAGSCTMGKQEGGQAQTLRAPGSEAILPRSVFWNSPGRRGLSA